MEFASSSHHFQLQSTLRVRGLSGDQHSFQRRRRRMGRLWFIILESRQRLDDVHQDEIRHGAASAAALLSLLLFGCVAVFCVRQAGSQRVREGWGSDMDECRVQSAIGMERSRASIRSTRRKGMPAVPLCRCHSILNNSGASFAMSSPGNRHPPSSFQAAHCRPRPQCSHQGRGWDSALL